MPQLVLCPWCQKLILLAGESTHSAHVELANADERSAEEVVQSYHPHPEKTYKTSIAQRRAALNHYYKNREDILNKMKNKRDAAKEVIHGT